MAFFQWLMFRWPAHWTKMDDTHELVLSVCIYCLNVSARSTGYEICIKIVGSIQIHKCNFFPTVPFQSYASPSHSLGSAVVQPFWPLRFGGCDRGQPVSISLRAEQWHLTQYPRRIRFLSCSPPSSASIYWWSVSSLCEGLLLLLLNPMKPGPPSSSAPLWR